MSEGMLSLRLKDGTLVMMRDHLQLMVPHGHWNDRFNIRLQYREQIMRGALADGLNGSHFKIPSRFPESYVLVQAENISGIPDFTEYDGERKASCIIKFSRCIQLTYVLSKPGCRKTRMRFQILVVQCRMPVPRPVPQCDKVLSVLPLLQMQMQLRAL